MARYELNETSNEVKIYFDSAPDVSIRNKLKAAKFLWNQEKRYWHATQNTETMCLVKRLCEENRPARVSMPVNKPKPEVASPVGNNRSCYAGYASDFLKENEAGFVEKMKAAFSANYKFDLCPEQIKAWRDCFKVMHNIKLNPNDGIIFEYDLPCESGRRTDVLLISKEHVIVLEFKMKNQILSADVDQAAAYDRNIQEYHYESREKNVFTILVLTRTSGIDEMRGNVRCVSSDNLQKYIDNYTKGDTKTDIEAWMNSKYEPLPTIVDAARTIFNKGELPNIRRVKETCIPKTLENIKKLTTYAKENKKHTIAFVTGVPGSGKTYLGLQYVYDIRGQDGKVNSVYLSGNWALVQVLTDALKSNVFVKDLHKVENEFLKYGSPDFASNVIVFDEGQRAWDSKQMCDKGRGNNSEPEVMIKLAEKCLDWCVLLILVGEGQSIHKGENSGIAQWNTAIDRGTCDWEVVYPSKLSDVFRNQTMVQGIDYAVFDLTKSLRSHLADNASTFINLILEGEISEAKKLAAQIVKAGYKMYFTRDLEKAKEYCRDRYHGDQNKRYGILVSSDKQTGLKKYGIDVPYKPDVAKWFNADPSLPDSSCALTGAITEFECQGLEIDMPIIGWGLDLRWDETHWKPNKKEGSDEYDYRINSYRVLLTRGRDGFIIFVPKDMDKEAEVLKSAGIKELEN